MTQDQIVKLIQLALPADKATNIEYAERLLPPAIAIVGRMNGTTFNTIRKTFATVSGQATYAIGVDIFGPESGIFGLENLWMTDSPYNRVPLVARDLFRAQKSTASTRTGYPELGSIYRAADLTYNLELFPIPAGVYNMDCEAHLPLKLDQIPDLYHDLVAKEAIMLFRSMNDTQALSAEIGRDRRDVGADSTTPWSGSVIRVDRPIGRMAGRKNADSFNLDGEL